MRSASDEPGGTDGFLDRRTHQEPSRSRVAVGCRSGTHFPAAAEGSGGTRATMRPVTSRFTHARVAAVIAVMVVASCGGDDDSGDAERFCGEVAENIEALTKPDLTASANPEVGIDALLDEYRRIGESAPLAIEAEWDQLVAAYEAADLVIAGDPQSEQEAIEAIFRAEQAAVKISDWLRTNCAVEIGPLATIVGSQITTTTLDPATTEPP